ncbi:23S rRNA (pseudouridine(1915)-N(3))-methyltransferase RlmH [Tannockella kyphosi]|uniref:23S rRNA (pseudouridine(1915)-N(3))-methyltransferase RlmH n=1 Tax=Tannockella kyphosi TaxID=2899121 RepID=UPI002013692F|nr:23S rRNA (pseudouridine(1915)-N(3))-methyltransferase RlmH [Tannockella kyphosi]
MLVKVITIGKLKEKYLLEGIKEYTKRLQAYTKIEYIEVSDESIPDKCSDATAQMIKEKEGFKVLSKIKQDDYVIVLDVQGKQIDSLELSNKMEQCMINGKSTIVFVIGGSLGHAKDILNRADFSLSFSKMTFPHQLMKLILVEQIYRAFKIMKNESYHK